MGRLEAGLQWLRALLDELEQQGPGSSSTAEQRPRQRQQQQQQQPPGRPPKRQRKQGAAEQPSGQDGSQQQEPQTQAGASSQQAAGTACAGDAAERAEPSSQPSQRIQVYGSVLIPSKKLLAQMKFRPWGGVFLR